MKPYFGFLMNRLGLSAPAGEFDSFTPSGGNGGVSAEDDDEPIEASNDGDDDDDDDPDLEEDEPDLSGQAPAARKPKQADPGYRMTPEQLQQLATQSALQAMQGQMGQGQQLSEADVHKLLGRPQVAAELIARLRNPEVTPEEAIQDLQSLLDGNFKYSLNAVNALLKNQLAPLLQMREQFQQQQQQQQVATFKKGLLNNYPALRKYGAAVDRAMSALAAEGFRAQGMSAEQVSKAVAQKTRNLIREIDPNFSLKQNRSNSTQAGSFTPRVTGRTGRSQQIPAGGVGSFFGILPQ